jgi:hypothetical protein
MFLQNKDITLPPEDTIVWKYLDLSKFLDMLLCRQLFMSRSDKFEDQYEGTFSEPTFEELKSISGNNPEFLDKYKQHRKNVVISSWHINEYESYAMWQIFTKNNEGLAIQSTIGRLQQALGPENRYEQHIGEVKYIDYKKEQQLFPVPVQAQGLSVRTRGAHYSRPYPPQPQHKRGRKGKCRHTPPYRKSVHTPQIRELV